MELLKSILIGFLIAATPGPIFFEVTRRTLTKGLSSGVMLAIGEFVGNLSLLLMIYFGISSFLTNDYLRLFFYLIGALLLIYIGTSAIRLTTNDIKSSQSKESNTNNSLFTGFFIAITSPIVIAFWISVSGSYLSKFSHEAALLNIVLIASGFLFFFIPFAYIINLTKNKINEKIIVILSKTFGVALVVYGLSFLYEFINLLKNVP